MYELTELEMQQINGGGAFLAYLMYALLGAALYKLWKSKKGRISLPRLITVEWEC